MYSSLLLKVFLISLCISFISPREVECDDYHGDFVDEIHLNNYKNGEMCVRFDVFKDEGKQLRIYFKKLPDEFWIEGRLQVCVTSDPSQTSRGSYDGYSGCMYTGSSSILIGSKTFKVYPGAALKKGKSYYLLVYSTGSGDQFKYSIENIYYKNFELVLGITIPLGVIIITLVIVFISCYFCRCCVTCCPECNIYKWFLSPEAYAAMEASASSASPIVPVTPVVQPAVVASPVVAPAYPQAQMAYMAPNYISQGVPGQNVQNYSSVQPQVQYPPQQMGMQSNVPYNNSGYVSGAYQPS